MTAVGPPIAMSANALGILGRFVDGPSPFAVAVPVQTGPAAQVALEGLLARDLLEVGESGIALGSELRAVATIAAAATDVLTAETSGPGEVTRVAWLLGPTSAIEQRQDPGVGFSLQILVADLVASRAMDLVAPTNQQALVRPTEVAIDAAVLASAMRRTRDGDRAPEGLSPTAADFARAMTGEVHRRAIDRRCMQRHGQVGGHRIEWFDAGDGGCWTVSDHGAQVVISSLDPQAFRVELEALLTAPARLDESGVR